MNEPVLEYHILQSHSAQPSPSVSVMSEREFWIEVRRACLTSIGLLKVARQSPVSDAMKVFVSMIASAIEKRYNVSNH